MEDIEIIVKAKRVFKASSDYLPDFEGEFFATEQEIIESEHISIVFKGDSVYDSDAQIIHINELRKLLDAAEKAGAIFVTVDFHTDHLEYDVVGYDIKRMNEKEIKFVEIMEQNIKNQKKEAKIKELEERIKKIKGE
jgi:hypothetical protein